MSESGPATPANTGIVENHPILLVPDNGVKIEPPTKIVDLSGEDVEGDVNVEEEEDGESVDDTTVENPSQEIRVSFNVALWA